MYQLTFPLKKNEVSCSLWTASRISRLQMDKKWHRKEGARKKWDDWSLVNWLSMERMNAAYRPMLQTHTSQQTQRRIMNSVVLRIGFTYRKRKPGKIKSANLTRTERNRTKSRWSHIYLDAHIVLVIGKEHITQCSNYTGFRAGSATLQDHPSLPPKNRWNVNISLHYLFIKLMAASNNKAKVKLSTKELGQLQN